MLGTIASRLRERLSYEVLVQGEAPRERLLGRFRQETDSVLVATATFWQGVDVAGESLSLLVMDKLPFASPGDPLTEARCERIVEHGGDWFDDYALPIATLQCARASAGSFAATPTAASPQSSTEAVHAGVRPACSTRCRRARWWTTSPTSSASSRTTRR